MERQPASDVPVEIDCKVVPAEVPLEILEEGAHSSLPFPPGVDSYDAVYVRVAVQYRSVFFLRQKRKRCTGIHSLEAANGGRGQNDVAEGAEPDKEGCSDSSRCYSLSPSQGRASSISITGISSRTW